MKVSVCMPEATGAKFIDKQKIIRKTNPTGEYKSKDE